LRRPGRQGGVPLHPDVRAERLPGLHRLQDGAHLPLVPELGLHAVGAERDLLHGGDKRQPELLRRQPLRGMEPVLRVQGLLLPLL